MAGSRRKACVKGNSAGRLRRTLNGSTSRMTAEREVAPARACRYHLSEAAVRSILNHKREPFFIGSYFNSLDEENKRIALEAAAEHKKIEDRYAVYQARIRAEYEANGFVALLDDYDETRAAVNAASCETFRRLAGEISRLNEFIQEAGLPLAFTS